MASCSQFSRNVPLVVGQLKEGILTRVSSNESFVDKVKKGFEAFKKAKWFQMEEKEVCLKEESLKSCLMG